MSNTKKKSAWMLGLFFAILALLTFFSRSIYASLLPQVKVAKVSSGTIATEIQTDKFHVESDVEKRVYVPAELAEENLTVEKLLVKTGARFSAGDALVRVSAYEGQHLLEKAESDLTIAVREEAEWQQAYDAGIEEMLVQLQQLEAQNKRTEASALKEKIRYISDEQIYEGIYLNDLMDTTKHCTNRRDWLLKLQENNWQIMADEDGVVLKWLKEENATISSCDALVVYAPEDANVQLHVGIDLEWLSFISSINAKVSYTDGTSEDWLYLGIEKNEAGEKLVMLTPKNEGTFEPATIEAIQLSVQSEYFDTVVSNRALEAGDLFVLRVRNGSWNTEEYYVEKVDAKILAEGGARIAVEGEINPGDLVIIQTTQALLDGDTVYLLQ